MGHVAIAVNDTYSFGLVLVKEWSPSITTSENMITEDILTETVVRLKRKSVCIWTAPLLLISMMHLKNTKSKKFIILSHLVQKKNRKVYLGMPM